jgi:hypothetical protein
MLDRRHCLWIVAAAVSAPLLAGPLDAWAQTAVDGTPPPGLKLSDAQRQLIYASISKQTHKSTAAPPTFNPRIGVVVPDAIELAPLPDTIVETVPQTRGYSYAFIANQVLVVDAKSRQVVELIAPSA